VLKVVARLSISCIINNSTILMTVWMWYFRDAQHTEQFVNSTTQSSCNINSRQQ
jgi:hypothetical protein